jgi:hypothetical protein
MDTGEVLHPEQLDQSRQKESDICRCKNALSTFEDELHYLVKWTGWPSECNQWVSKDSVANAPKIIAKYEKE